MSGVKAVTYLLANDAPVIAAMVAAGTGADSVMGGDAPIDWPLPAVSVKTVSGNPRNNLAVTRVGQIHRERVQVTVTGHDFTLVKAIALLLLDAVCPQALVRRGTINGVTVEAIIPDEEGPDFSNVETSIHGVSRDFMVIWKS